MTGVIKEQELKFVEFAAANRDRCEALTGFNHARDGVPGNKETPGELQLKLRKELGDVFVYLDLLCQSLGFTVAEAAVEVFNEKSEEIGYPVRLWKEPPL